MIQSKLALKTIGRRHRVLVMIGAVLIGAAFSPHRLDAACGDWLEHPAIDSPQPREVLKPPAAPLPLPCAGGQCRQSPQDHVPTLPTPELRHRLDDRMVSEPAGYQAAISPGDAAVCRSSAKPCAGFSHLIERPPRVD